MTHFNHQNGGAKKPGIFNQISRLLNGNGSGSDSIRLNSTKRILLVDDDEVFCGLLKKILQNSGFIVADAGNGKIAKHLIEIEMFDIILADIQMPEMDGMELLQFVRNTKPSPVILMTGFSELVGEEEAKDAGAFAYLLKPFTRLELLNCIQQVLNPTVEEDSLIRKAG